MIKGGDARLEKVDPPSVMVVCFACGKQFVLILEDMHSKNFTVCPDCSYLLST